MTTQVPRQKITTILGRHTRIGVRFTWSIDGTPVSLQTGAFEANAWVTKPDGETISGPHEMTIDGSVATYMLQVGDLDEASLSEEQNVLIVAVAENTTMTLVSNPVLELQIGHWSGADGYPPGD